MGINSKQRLTAAVRVLLDRKTPPSARTDLYTDEVSAISPEEVAEAKEFFPLDKFFVFGHARSGTTLLTRLIRLHPEVHCNYQGHFFTRPPLLQSLVSDHEIKTWLTRRSNRWNHGKDLSPVILRAAVDFILERDARREGKTIVGDKSPSSLLNGKAVKLMHKVYPDASLIYIIRDGRDAVVSHRFQTFIDGTQHLSKEDWRIRQALTGKADPFTEGERSIFTEKGISRAAHGWVQNVQETDEMGKALYDERYITLRFEDLLESPWNEIRRLWDFLGASTEMTGLEDSLQEELGKNPDSDWQHEKAGDIARSMQKGSPGYWQEVFTSRDREIFEEIAGETLAAWDYTL